MTLYAADEFYPDFDTPDPYEYLDCGPVCEECDTEVETVDGDGVCAACAGYYATNLAG